MARGSARGGFLRRSLAGSAQLNGRSRRCRSPRPTRVGQRPAPTAATVPAAERRVLERRRLARPGIGWGSKESGSVHTPGVEMQCGQGDSDHIAGRAEERLRRRVARLRLTQDDGHRRVHARMSPVPPRRGRGSAAISPRRGRHALAPRRPATRMRSSRWMWYSAHANDVELVSCPGGEHRAQLLTEGVIAAGCSRLRRSPQRIRSRMSPPRWPLPLFAPRSAGDSRRSSCARKATNRAHGPRPAISRRSQGASISGAVPERISSVVTRAYSARRRAVLVTPNTTRITTSSVMACAASRTSNRSPGCHACDFVVRGVGYHDRGSRGSRSP